MFMISRKHLEQPSGPNGRRAYVVGDIHGRLDLLDLLLEQIHADMKSRPPAKTLLVFVGDLIDRGPSSAEVVERLRTYRHDGVTTVFILGNHEEVLLRILDGDRSLVRSWLSFGGAQCLQSYGIDALQLTGLSDSRIMQKVREAVPPQHVEFLRAFVDSCRFGDYLFVHAGIRPGVELREQRQSDLRWIREPFLLDDTAHGFIVVHGHTISEEVEEKANRIGIDTGAFATGNLTALGIEGTERWYLDTRAHADIAVSTAH
jgi:serine/threonine protein phosphatase 1